MSKIEKLRRKMEEADRKSWILTPAFLKAQEMCKKYEELAHKAQARWLKAVQKCAVLRVKTSIDFCDARKALEDAIKLDAEEKKCQE